MYNFKYNSIYNATKKKRIIDRQLIVTKLIYRMFQRQSYRYHLIALIVFSPRLRCTSTIELQRVHSRMQICTRRVPSRPWFTIR